VFVHEKNKLFFCAPKISLKFFCFFVSTNPIFLGIYIYMSLLFFLVRYSFYQGVFWMFDFGKKGAQGTIEYLVILAVIIVVGLIVVSLLINSTAPAASVSSTTGKIGGWTNAISVTETSISPDGNYLVRLANNTGAPLTVKTVKVGDQEVNYSEDLFQGNQQNFKITSDMVCEIGQSVTGDLVVTYVTEHGLEKTETYPANITFECNDYVVNLLANQCPECGETCSGGNQSLSDSTTTVNAGCYTATNLDTVDTDLTAENIVEGATIFGITGTASAGGVEADYYFSEDKSYFSRTEPVSGQGIVTDSKNGLIWQDGIKGGTDTWANAGTYCSGLNWGGFSSDWRLPTVYELYTLVDIEYSGSSYFPSAFQTVGTVSEYNMWSSSPVPSLPSSAYTLDSYYGHIIIDSKNENSFTGVRCVRSES
jgi:hypothetical protein